MALLDVLCYCWPDFSESSACLACSAFVYINGVLVTCLHQFVHTYVGLQLKCAHYAGNGRCYCGSAAKWHISESAYPVESESSKEGGKAKMAANILLVTPQTVSAFH